jgi:hypothetical protein
MIRLMSRLTRPKVGPMVLKAAMSRPKASTHRPKAALHRPKAAL